MFLGIVFTNRNIFEKYFRMNLFSGLAAKNHILSLFVGSGLKLIFHWKF